MTTTLVPSQKSSNLESSQSLVLKQSISLMDCLRSCWRDDVLLLSCSDKFLRLFLQLLSRSVYSIVLLKRCIMMSRTNIFAGNATFYCADTPIGCQLDLVLGKLVMQLPVLDLNGQYLLPQMIFFMYVSHLIRSHMIVLCMSYFLAFLHVAFIYLPT